MQAGVELADKDAGYMRPQLCVTGANMMPQLCDTVANMRAQFCVMQASDELTAKHSMRPARDRGWRAALHGATALALACTASQRCGVQKHDCQPIQAILVLRRHWRAPLA